MKAKITFHVDGSYNQRPQREIVEVYINPTDEEHEAFKKGLAFLEERQGSFLFGFMPTYAVNSGYSNIKLVKLLKD